MSDPETMETEPATDETSASTSAPPAPPLPAPRAPEPAPHYAHHAPPRQDSPQPRMPFLAAFFSLFPGLGNIYNGLYLRGITIFVICIGLVGLASQSQVEERVLLVFTLIFVWLFNIFDAYRQATLINYGYTPEIEPAAKPKIPAWGSGGLVAGVVVFVLGLYGLLRQQFDIDLALLAEYWYVLFMAFGAFLIARTVLERKRADEDSAIEMADHL